MYCNKEDLINIIKEEEEDVVSISSLLFRIGIRDKLPIYMKYEDILHNEETLKSMIYRYYPNASNIEDEIESNSMYLIDYRNELLDKVIDDLIETYVDIEYVTITDIVEDLIPYIMEPTLIDSSIEIGPVSLVIQLKDRD